MERIVTVRWFRQHAALLVAALAAVILSLPGFSLTYVFDDYNFLGSAQRFNAGSLGPDPGSLLYRPVSRELYFGLLNRFCPGNAFGGHMINGGLLAAAVFLGATLTSRLAGKRAGIIAG